MNNEDYIKKLEKENQELTKELETIQELKEKLSGWETACLIERQEIEKLKNFNNTQAKMIARLEQQCGMTPPYQPLGSLSDQWYANKYKEKLVEQLINAKLCELPKTVFISNADKNELKNISDSIGYKNGL